MNFYHSKIETEHPQANAFELDQRLKGIKILLVEDEPDTASLLTFILTDSGAEVIVTELARQALLLVEQEQPNILVSDICLPDRNGDWLIREIRSRYQEQSKFLPAIAITSYSRRTSKQELLAAGFQRVFDKFIEPEWLIEEVIQLIQSSQP